MRWKHSGGIETLECDSVSDAVSVNCDGSRQVDLSSRMFTNYNDILSPMIPKI